MFRFNKSQKSEFMPPFAHQCLPLPPNARLCCPILPDAFPNIGKQLKYLTTQSSVGLRCIKCRVMSGNNVGHSFPPIGFGTCRLHIYNGIFSRNIVYGNFPGSNRLVQKNSLKFLEKIKTDKYRSYNVTMS